MDLGDGDDQIVIQYNGILDVGTDLVLGNGKDRFVSRGDVVVGGARGLFRADDTKGAGPEAPACRGAGSPRGLQRTAACTSMTRTPLPRERGGVGRGKDGGWRWGGS